MGAALRYPDGSVREVDNDQIASEVARGATPPATISVDVDMPGGLGKRTTVIPYADFADGTLNPTSEDTVRAQGHLADLEGETSFGGALLRNFGEELTFGAYKPDEDQALADKTYQPWGSGFGTAAGIAVPLLIPGLGEAGLARNVASIGRGAKVASKAGRGFRELSALGKAGELLPGRAVAQLGAGVSKRLGGGLAGNVVGAGVEEAGRATLRAALDRDVDLSGEAVLDSALFGMAGGGVGYGVAKIAKKAEEAVEDLKGRLSRVSKVDDEALVKRLNSNRDPTPSMLGKTDAEHAAGIKAGLGEDVSLAGANQAVVRDAASLANQVKAFRTSALAPGLSKEVTEVIDRGLESANLLRGYARQSPAVQARVMSSYGNHLQDIDAMANAARVAGMDVTKLPSRFMPGNLAARQSAISSLAPGANAAEDAAQRLALRLTAGTERATASQGIASSLVSRIPVVGKLLGKASDSPLASVAIIDAIVNGGLGTATTTVLALKGAAKLIKKAYEVPGRGLSLSAMAGDAIGKLGLEPHDRKPASIVHAIRSLSPDQASQMAVRGVGPIGELHTDVALGAGNAAANRHSLVQRRIDSIFPQSRGALSLRNMRPTSLQVRALDRTLTIAGDPTAFARLWASGRLSAEDLAFASQVWPAHVNRAKTLAISWLSDQEPGSVSRSTRHRLEMLLGADAVGSQRNDSALAAQGSITAANARAQQAKKSGPPPGVTPGGPPSTSLMSPALAASTRPTD